MKKLIILVVCLLGLASATQAQFSHIMQRADGTFYKVPENKESDMDLGVFPDSIAKKFKLSLEEQAWILENPGKKVKKEERLNRWSVFFFEKREIISFIFFSPQTEKVEVITTYSPWSTWWWYLFVGFASSVIGFLFFFLLFLVFLEKKKLLAIFIYWFLNIAYVIMMFYYFSLSFAVLCFVLAVVFRKTIISGLMEKKENEKEKADKQVCER